MNEVVSKTLVFICFMIIGAILKLKFSCKEEKDGLKKLILNLVLPATIFTALLKVTIDKEYILLPVTALAFNILLFLLTPQFLSLIGIPRRSAIGRTSRMLVPSLAPGLSCFPFILEFLGEEYLAKAAMADLGNKLFVLLVLYLVAIHWFRKNAREKAPSLSRKDQLLSLIKKMATEPVNIFMFAAIILILAGINLDHFPPFLMNIIEPISLIMTPLILLYIGLALRIKKKQMRVILCILSFRAGIALIMVGGFVVLMGISVNQNILLAIAFALSSCSFWPYMHLAMVDKEETELKIKDKTFDPDFGIALLAFSLPFSVLFILFVLTTDELFTQPFYIFTVGGALLGIGMLPSICIGIKQLLSPPAITAKPPVIEAIWKQEDSQQ